MGTFLAWLAACAVAFAALCAPPARAQGCGSTPATLPPVNVAPIVLRILGPPVVPVPAADGLVHLAYAAQVTNLAFDPVEIVGVVPVDPGRDNQPTGTNAVRDVDGASITSKVRIFGLPPTDARDQTTLGAGRSGIMFFDVTYPDAKSVPASLAHRIETRVAGQATLSVLTTGQALACEAPVRLSPPLTGHGWWDGNGCCRTIDAHRSATLPVNGAIRPPEQFAIDFVQIGSDGACCHGPTADVRSWRFYGVPILAVAAGTIVEAIDTSPDQVPGPPKGVTAQNAGGNDVIEDIGGGRFAAYAHMRPGSVLVHAGERVSAGQKIGELGNSGSSTGPHLHFQVMDRPSLLDSVGLPFVFDRQILEGEVEGTPATVETAYDAGRALRLDRRTTGARDGQMPTEGQVFGFHLDDESPK